MGGVGVRVLWVWLGTWVGAAQWKMKRERGIEVSLSMYNRVIKVAEIKNPHQKRKIVSRESCKSSY